MQTSATGECQEIPKPNRFENLEIETISGDALAADGAKPSAAGSRIEANSELELSRGVLLAATVKIRH